MVALVRALKDHTFIASMRSRLTDFVYFKLIRVKVYI